MIVHLIAIFNIYSTKLQRKLLQLMGLYTPSQEALLYDRGSPAARNRCQQMFVEFKCIRRILLAIDGQLSDDITEQVW